MSTNIVYTEAVKSDVSPMVFTQQYVRVYKGIQNTTQLNDGGLRQYCV